MASDVDLARGVMADARRMFAQNTGALTLDEALFVAGGYRSMLGVMKHIGGWVHVYRSYAFDAAPRHWAQTEWPRGLIDEVELSDQYLAEVRAWVDDGLQRWDRDLAGVAAGGMGEPRPAHWGGTLPLGSIVTAAAHHVVYHTGELNMLLSIKRGEAWEYTEEVEENHISTVGRGVRPNWMSDEMARAHETRLRARP